MSSEHRSSETFMEKVARLIVDKRNAFFLIFLAATIFAAVSISKVQVNDDLTKYLPETTETRRGLDVMDKEFITLGTANIMVSNITYNEASLLSDQIADIPGVSEVDFDDTTDHYKDSSALFTVTFDYDEDDPKAKESLEDVEALLDGYDVYPSTTVGRDTSADLQKEMSVILAIAAVVIVAVLLFTSKSYMEVPVYLIVFVVAAILNMGTNYIFGTISFVTNSIAIVLQLAMAIDYAIIFCHRYMEERDNGLDSREADITALSKAIVEISSSSLTTISGLVALMLMQFKLGYDMGIVLVKGILFSMISVFFLMPGLLMLFGKSIERTRHRNLVPHINLWGKVVLKLRYILPIVFVAVIAVGAVLSNKCDYVFIENDTDFDNKPDWRIADDKVADTFGQKTTIALLVPTGNYDDEGRILREVAELPEITQATGLANTEADLGDDDEDGGVSVKDDSDVTYLTDSLTPRQFADLVDVDIEVAKVLYQAYGIDKEDYTPIFQDVDEYTIPLIDSLEFMLDERDKGVVSFEGNQAQDMDDLKDALDKGTAQLRGENWDRMVFIADCPQEGAESYDLLEQIRSIAQVYYGDDVMLVGNTTNARDMSSSFSGDNMKISVLTALFVMIILLFTFKSTSLPILLVMTIQGSIWINFSIPYLTGVNMFFVSYLVVSSIQMGATIDYAIVITNRYMTLRDTMDHKKAIIQSLDESFATVLTSGSIMSAAGFLIAKISTNATIGSVGLALGRGTLTSIVLVMTVLPQLLLLGDRFLERTTITLRGKRHEQTVQKGIMRVDGHLRGHVSGFVDGQFNGILHGSVDAYVENKKSIPTPGGDTPELPEDSARQDQQEEDTHENDHP
ncbi:RND family transporter [Pseudoflavonifractor sp. MSJ-37]|uniref:efflux RND transporter permease subunit n=1 Tax=Pseudoflavonifractor sp. MSJ-37 TaxID=2841531 RepID=UPI001C129619|nr:MMPL family transporter [Pseudoflavonifractor sp. MSJ-37]MBU5434670.1 MMPL family transporter [Pseudoflavonifractor sp. MSJ-37]